MPAAPKPTKSSPAYPVVVDRLVEEFARLPGIGRRSAERLAFHILKADEPSAMALSRAIADVKRNVRRCAICSNFADADVCSVCANDARDRALILVVEQPKDLIALEQTGMFKGVYHVLMGRLAPLEGVGPHDLTIDSLLARASNPHANFGPDAPAAARTSSGIKVREVVLGLNPNIEGDGTGLYLIQELKKLGVPVSRLARGLPTGSQLEYANKAVLTDAIQGRQRVE